MVVGVHGEDRNSSRSDQIQIESIGGGGNVVLAVRAITDTEDSDSNTTLSISHLQDQYSREKQSAEIFLQRDKPDSG